MSEAPKVEISASDLVSAGVSRPYAYNILKGWRRPSMTMALRIYDRLGVQMGPLEGLTTEEVALARRMAEAA